MADHQNRFFHRKKIMTIFFRMCGSALRTVGKTIVSDGMAGGIL